MIFSRSSKGILLFFAFNFCYFPFISASKYCVFNPPKEWKMATPESRPSHVKICFIKEKESGFCPSLNLATEEVDISLEDYIKIIKELHINNPNNIWRDLGKVDTQAGPARLTAIDTKTEWGDTRLLQLIFLKDSTIYILTGGALKEEFANYYSQFFEAFRSLKFSDDLFDHVSDSEQKLSLQKSFDYLILSWQKKAHLLESDSLASIDLETEEFKTFQKEIAKYSETLGTYWQILMVQCVVEKMLSLNNLKLD